MNASSRTHDKTPTVSRVFSDGTMVELLYDPTRETTALAIREPNGRVRKESEYEAATKERLVPYSPRNNLLASGCVLLPADIGDVGDKDALLQDVQGFLHRYVDLAPTFEEIAAHYVLLTWVYDAFNELPYLRFRGDYGTGKTRALMALGSLCYKPFFASGASTVSPIFHVLDAFGGTLVLDEADFRFSDTTAELTKILNNGTVKGMPVLRTMANRHRELNPQAFRVFGPKIIGMRESFADRALESRFLTEETGRRPLRSDIPIHLPDDLAQEALTLRNRLLAWRLRERFVVGPDATRTVPGISPRLNQTALALLSIMDDSALRSRVVAELVGEEARVRQERASSLEATMLVALLEGLAASAGPHVSVSETTHRFNQLACSELGRAMSPRWVGGFIRNRLRLVTMKSHGVYVVPRTECTAIDTLAARYAAVSEEGEHAS